MRRRRCRPDWTVPERIAHLSRRDPLTGCWLWQAATMPRGYGLINWRDKLWLAHRLSWTAVHGPIPRGGMICHRCDERRCVNPDHLFLGTRQVNMDDLKAKRLRRSAAADTGRMHIFIRGLELVGDITWENDDEHQSSAIAGRGLHCQRTHEQRSTVRDGRTPSRGARR